MSARTTAPTELEAQVRAWVRDELANGPARIRAERAAAERARIEEALDAYRAELADRRVSVGVVNALTPSGLRQIPNNWPLPSADPAVAACPDRFRALRPREIEVRLKNRRRELERAARI